MKKSGGKKRKVALVIGLVVSAIFLFLSLRRINFHELWQTLLSSHWWPWYVLAPAVYVLGLLVRGLRCREILRPHCDLPVSTSTNIVVIGYAANNVLPARLGELVRCHYLGDREHISRTTTLGTVVVERVVDTAVVVSIASLAILVLNVRGLVASAVLVGLAITALLVVGLIIGLTAHRLPGAERVIAWAQRWPRLVDVTGKLRGGLAVAGRPRTLAEALALSVVAWGATVVAFAAAGQALGVQLTVAQAALLAAGVALATGIPSGPSNLGTFDLAAVAILGTFGVDRETALAIALLAHASVLVITSIGGAVSLLRLGWRHNRETPPGAATAAGIGGS